MLRIFIDFGSESAAIGTHAMVISTLKLLQEIFPGAEFTILSIYPEVDRRRYGRFGFNLNIVRRARGNAGAAWAQLRQCSKADIVVGVYGDAFVASTNLALLEFIAKMLVVTLPGKPVVIFPSSMGPFARGWRSFMVRRTLKRVKLVAAREETTYRHLQEVGIDERLITLIPDVAFALPSAPQARLEEILAKEGINTAQRPLIGLRIHPLNFYPGFSEVKQDYIQLMAQVTDYLVTSLNATVVFIPYYIWPKEVTKMRDIAARAGGDDITIIREVFNKAQCKDRVVPIETEYGAVELNGIIGQCDLFIGAAMHCNIAAISMCVPTISIDFRYKTPAVMKMAGLEKYYCDLSTVTPVELTSKIDDLWNNRENTRRMLRSKVEEFRASIYSFGESLRGLLEPSSKIHS